MVFQGQSLRSLHSLSADPRRERAKRGMRKRDGSQGDQTHTLILTKVTLVGDFFFFLSYLCTVSPRRRLLPQPLSSSPAPASIPPSVEHRDTRYDANESTRQEKERKREREEQKFPLFRLSCAPPYSIYRVAWTLAYAYGGSFGWTREREMGGEHGTPRAGRVSLEGRKARDEIRHALTTRHARTSLKKDP